MFISGQMDVQTASARSLHVTQDSRAQVNGAELSSGLLKPKGEKKAKKKLGALVDACLMERRASFMASKKRDSSPIVRGRHTGDINNPETNLRSARDKVELKSSSQRRDDLLI